MSVWKDLVAGSVGGVTMTVFGHPCDLIKTKLQSEVRAYRGMTHCLIDTVHAEGPRGLFRGMSPPLMMASVMNASLFGISACMKKFVASVNHKDENELTMREILLASELSVPFYVGVVTPVERLKVCLINQKAGSPKFEGPIDVIRSVGMRGLFRGYSVIVLMRCLGLPAYLSSYEWMKRSLLGTNYLKADPLSNIRAYMLAGATAGFAFWTVTFPVDFVKTRIQEQSMGTKRVSALDVVRNIYRERGIAGFYRGIAPCLIRAGPSNALCFATVEVVKSLLSRGE
eukprot:g85.t1